MHLYSTTTTTTTTPHVKARRLTTAQEKERAGMKFCTGCDERNTTRVEGMEGRLQEISGVIKLKRNE